MAKQTDDIEDLDFKFIDPSNFDDADGGAVSAARKQALINEAISVAQQSWLVSKSADNDQARADAIDIPDLPATAGEDDEPVDDPYEDERAEKERLLNAVEMARSQVDALDKSFQRKKARLSAAGATITKKDIDNAKKAMLVGQRDAQGNTSGGYLQQLEQEFINHRQNRRRAQKALAMTGALALNEQEAAEAQQRVDDATQNLIVLKSLIKLYRQELISLGGSLPSKVGEEAPVGQANNRQARRSVKKG